MAAGQTRPRSSTSGSTISNRPRPASRASTTSLNTPVEQVAQGNQYVFASTPSQSQRSAAATANAYTPEEMIGRSEHQLTNPEQAFLVDPSLQGHTSQSRPLSAETGYVGRQDMSRPLIHSISSIDGKENSIFPTIGENKTQIGAAMLEAQKKPKGNASSQANDQELRRLYRENRHRDLKDVAASVLANERGPKSEKTKQIFAMNWLSTVCKKSNTSVPRSRVYAQYALRCGTERVSLLNPASFGKLVRIIFPDITTRRLGMRGESKYHYVDLALIDDEPDVQEPLAAGNPLQANGVDVDTLAPLPTAVSIETERSHFPADTAEFPSPITIRDSQPPLIGPQLKPEAQGHLFLDRSLPNIHRGPSRPNMISRQLKFSTNKGGETPDEAPIELPDLQQFLPHGTDADTAGALKALYRAHCISVIDCVRFCKERSFWHHFTSLHGTLTVPVQKLFAHPDVSPWIRECDWLMYQKMIQFVSPLALQVMPEVVTSAFQSISDNLPHQVQTIFQHHPQHVRDAKHGPAVIFAGLLGRLLRVNAASHAAAHILGNDATRDQMWHDWVHHVKPTVTAETCLPGVGYSRCIQILTNDIRDLLSPLGTISYPSMQQIYASIGPNFGGGTSHFNDLDDSTTSSVLDRWVTFLHGLPLRFPNADARTMLHCVSDVGTAALRDITMATAVSFGQWTVTKVWVDEMMQWLAEKGGFLDYSPSSTEMRPKKRSASEADLEDGDNPDPRRGRSSTDKAPTKSQYGFRDLDLGFQCEENKDVHQSQDFNFVGPEGNDDYASYDQENAADRRYRSSQRPVQTEGPSELSRYDERSLHNHVLAPTEEDNHSRQSDQEKAGDGAEDEVGSVGQKHYRIDDSNEDSGIGLDLEVSEQQTPIRLADYGGFVASNANSDPADVIVC